MIGMAVLATDAPSAMDPGLRGRVPARTSGPAAGAVAAEHLG